MVAQHGKGSIERYRGREELRNFDKGTKHFYDGASSAPPHSRNKIDSVNPVSLYVSTHILIESDRWTELAGAIAGIVQDAVENPLSTLAGPIAGAGGSGAPGVGAAAGGAGAVVDATLDALSGELLTKVGAKAQALAPITL